MSTANIQAQIKAFNADVRIAAARYFIQHLYDDTLTPRSACDFIDLGDDDTVLELNDEEKLCNLLINANISAKEAIYRLLSTIIPKLDADHPLSSMLVHLFNSFNIFAFHYDTQHSQSSYILTNSMHNIFNTNTKAKLLVSLCNDAKVIYCKSKKDNEYVRINFSDFICANDTPTTIANIVKRYKHKEDEYNVKVSKREAELNKLANNYDDESKFITFVTIDHKLTFNVMKHITSIVRNAYFYKKHGVSAEQEQRYEELRYTIPVTGQIIETHYLYNVIVILDFDIHQSIDDMKRYLTGLSTEVKTQYADKFNKLHSFFFADNVIDVVRGYIIDYFEDKLDNDDHTLPFIVTAHGGLHMWLINNDPSNHYNNYTLNSRNRFINILHSLNYKQPYDISSDITFDSLTEDNFFYLFQLDIFTSNYYGKDTAGNILPGTKVKDDPNDDKELKYKCYSEAFTEDTPFTVSIQDIMDNCSIFSSYVNDSYLGSITPDASEEEHTKLTNDELQRCLNAYNLAFNAAYYKADKGLALTNAVKRLWLKVLERRCKPTECGYIHCRTNNRSYVYKNDSKPHNYQHSLINYYNAMQSVDEAHQAIVKAYNDLFLDDTHFTLSEHAKNYKSSNMDDMIDAYVDALEEDEEGNVPSTLNIDDDSLAVVPSNLKYPISMLECMDKELYDSDNADATYVRTTMKMLLNASKSAWKRTTTAITEERIEAATKDIDLHSMNSIEHYTLSQLRSMPEAERKASIFKAIRFYSHNKNSKFYCYINDTPNTVDEYDETDLGSSLLECLFKKGKAVNDLISDIKQKCVLDNYIFDIKDIYKADALSLVNDEHPDTYTKHVSTYLNRLYDGACNGDKEAYEYMLMRQAWIIQNMMRSSKTIDVVVGKQKCGKTFDAEMFGLVLDRRPTVNCLDDNDIARVDARFVDPAAKLRDIVGNFTGIEAYPRYIIINELPATGNNEHQAHDDYQNLKSLTDTVRNVHYKGKTAYRVINTLNLSFTSNNTRCICPDIFETRFFVHEINPRHDIHDVSYWRKIRSIYSEPFFFKHIYDYLSTLPLDDFNVTSPPVTPSYVNIVVTNANSLNRFVLNNVERLREGLTKKEFNLLIDNTSALGCYKSKDNMFNDYTTVYTCEHKQIEMNSARGRVKVTKYVMNASNYKIISSFKRVYDTYFSGVTILGDDEDADAAINEFDATIADIVKAIAAATKEVTISSITYRYMTTQGKKSLLSECDDKEFMQRVLDALGFREDNKRIDGKKTRVMITTQAKYDEMIDNDNQLLIEVVSE